MKISTKPISSPGRAEKFPPPLMRFLRTNVGSRSRGRSKSSPMFFKKKNSSNNKTAAAAAIETQEPSSPKVTCMGQVRVTRSKKNKKKPPRSTKKSSRLLRKPCFRISCMLCPVNFKWKMFKPNCSFFGWFRCVSCCHAVSGRKVESREDSMRKEKDLEFVNKEVGNNDTSKVKREENDVGEEEPDQLEEEDEDRVYETSYCVTPPKNALLLTRCRSAPYRSSSLASRFWDSPLKDGEKTKQDNKVSSPPPIVNDNEVSNFEDEEEGLKPVSKKDFENDEDGVEISIRERMIKSTNDNKLGCEEDGEGKEEEVEEGGSARRRPLILTRCKSEPSRTAAKKLDPELNFWRKRRLESADSLSPHAISLN